MGIVKDQWLPGPQVKGKIRWDFFNDYEALFIIIMIFSEIYMKHNENLVQCVSEQ